MTDEEMEQLMARADVWLAAKKQKEADEASQRQDRASPFIARPRSTTITTPPPPAPITTPRRPS